MRVATIITRWVVRLTGLAQIILGVVFWTGHALGLIPLHMSLGGLFVLGLFVLGVMALVSGAGRGFGAFAILWGIVVLALGMAQTRLLIGSAHWVIRVLHLLVGLAAMGIGDRLARGLLDAAGRRAASVVPQRAA